jgi:hypothetical protein
MKMKIWGKAKPNTGNTGDLILVVVTSMTVHVCNLPWYRELPSIGHKSVVPILD